MSKDNTDNTNNNQNADLDAIVKRVQRLMALAQDKGASDNEATLAYARAQKLIDEYKIKHWEENRTKSFDIIEQAVDLTKSRANEESQMAAVAAHANDCEVYLHKTLGNNGHPKMIQVVFVGETRDVEHATVLFQSMCIAANVHEKKAYKSHINMRAEHLTRQYPNENITEIKNVVKKVVKRNVFRRSFWYGFTEKIDQRFKDIEEAKLSTNTGRELVAMRGAKIDEYMAGLNLREGRTRAKSYYAPAIAEGEQAANNVDIGVTAVETAS